MRGVSRGHKVIATRVQVARQSGGPGKWWGSCFESLRRIARRQVYCVVYFDTDRKRGEGRTSGLPEMGLKL